MTLKGWFTPEKEDSLIIYSPPFWWRRWGKCLSPQNTSGVSGVNRVAAKSNMIKANGDHVLKCKKQPIVNKQEMFLLQFLRELVIQCASRDETSRINFLFYLLFFMNKLLSYDVCDLLSVTLILILLWFVVNFISFVAKHFVTCIEKCYRNKDIVNYIFFSNCNFPLCSTMVRFQQNYWFESFSLALFLMPFNR